MKYNANKSFDKNVIFMENVKDIAPINGDLNVAKYEIENIKSLIYNIRGKQVMLVSDVAMLYHYETKKINQAVRRNIERFPEKFCFQLTEKEVSDNWSQIVTSSDKEDIKHRGKKYLPLAFTEQGIAMLSGILRKEARNILEKERNVESERWIEHSISVGNSAGRIAKALAEKGINIDIDKSIALGYIHDIGRKYNEHGGVFPHAINCYNYLKELGYDEEYAGICIKHSFLNNDIDCLANDRDETDKTNSNYDFFKEYIKIIKNRIMFTI